MQNNSDMPFEIKEGQRIAQMVIKKISHPTVAIVPRLGETTWGTKGFGSTEKTYNSIAPIAIDCNDTYPTSTTAAAATLNANDEIGNIVFSDNPFDNELDIYIQNKGDHPTQGLDVTYCDKYEKVQLIACEKGTPAGKVDKWRSTLRNGFILSVNTIQLPASHNLSV
jgi:hypothetical protein